jgi:UDP-4-amino-4,6-dideoxy-N-acetyl-beta-L-altrosamine N-acetyltransferase
MALSTARGHLRPATDGDREMVRQWRNHPQVRRASFTTHVISAEEHARWWRAVHTDPTRRLLIFEWEGHPSGVVTFREPTPADGTADWGFYLDVAGLTEREALLPAWIALETAAVRYAFDTAGFTRLRGEVLAWNESVLALHKRIGFTVVGSYQRDIDGTPQTVLRIELDPAHRRDRRRPSEGEA